MSETRMALKRAFGAIARLGVRADRRRAILLYHSIGESPFALPETQFRDQVAWLAEHTRILPLCDVLAGASEAPLQVAITFDDGYSSVYSAAYPVLRQHGAVASVFLNTGWIAMQERKASNAALGHCPKEHFLLWREVEALAEAGWEIGSHGIEHFDLTREPDSVVQRELKESRRQIESRIGCVSPVFSYTWGRNTKRLRRSVETAGYTYALAGIHAPLSDSDDRFAVPRMNIDRLCVLADFAAIVHGDWDYLGWIQRGRAGLSWLHLLQPVQ